MASPFCEPSCEVCARLRTAALKLIGKAGINTLTIESLAEQAVVPLGDARDHYPDHRACLLDTYDEVSLSIYEDFARCFVVVPGWRRALILAGRTLLERLASRPAEARLCFVEVLRGDHELLRRREDSRRRLVDLFVAELGHRRAQPEQFRVQLELLIGAGFQAIATAVISGDISELPELEPELESRASVFEPVVA